MDETSHGRGDWTTTLKQTGACFCVACQLALLIPRTEHEVAHHQYPIALAPTPPPHFSHQHAPDTFYSAESPAKSDLAQTGSRNVVFGSALAHATSATSASARVVRSGSAT